MALSRCTVIFLPVENSSLAAMPAETRVLAVMLSESAPSQGKRSKLAAAVHIGTKLAAFRYRSPYRSSMVPGMMFKTYG